MNEIMERVRQPLGRMGLADDDYFGRAMRDMLGPLWRPMRWVEEASSEALIPLMDVVERDGEFVVRADLPGVKKEDIHVTLENGVLTITAESRSGTEEKTGSAVRCERRFGRYERSLRLGTQVDETRIAATYKDGVLELTLPKAEAAKPRKISVDVA